ncbi:hypothetical protein [Micromonospora rosaria]
MVDNGRNSSSARRARQRAIRAEMARTGDPYNVVARRHDEREEPRREAKQAARKMPIARCPRCRQAEVHIDEQPSCPGCGAVWESGAELAGEYAEEILGLNSYTWVKDGGEEPTAECPDCGEQAVVSIQPGDTTFWTMMCMSCESLFNDRCTRCSAPQHREDGDLIICTTCWNDVVSRS